jgi:hypothetical protein
LPPTEGKNVDAGSKDEAVGEGERMDWVAVNTTEVTVAAMVEAIVDPLM